MLLSNRRAASVVAVAALLPAILFAVSTYSNAAEDHMAQSAPMSVSPSTSAQPPATKPVLTGPATPARPSVDRIEARIADLHKKLRVTADQEVLWNDFAQVMRENEKKMRDSIAARSEQMKVMSAVDDLKSYQMITDEHADGLKRLIPAFEALYAKMTPAQQQNADHVFDNQQRHTQSKS